MLGAVRVTSDSLTPVVESIAIRYGVDPNLVKGIIKKESNWDVNASRYEAHLKDSSWGLMQVLLQTAKEVLGNTGLTISQLIAPETNIAAGTGYIAKQLGRYGGNVRDAIAAYNSGSVKKNKDGSYINQSYVDDVYRNYMMYKTIGSAITPQEAGIGIGVVTAAIAAGLLIMRR